MSKTLLYALLSISLFSSFLVSAQSHQHRHIAMSSTTGGYFEYLPFEFDSTGNTKYPLIVFIHGNSERGKGDSVDIKRISDRGLPKMMREPGFPTSFKVSNKEHRFIVISPQFVPRPRVVDIDSVFRYILTHYPVDSSLMSLESRW